MTQNVILEVKGISKRFGGIKALENIDFDVRIGEIHSLVGENGAGKSTLMNILNGSIREDSGEIFLKNKLIKIKNPHIAKQLGISMVHQELKLIPELTVAENIFFGRQSKHFFVNWGNLFRKTDKVLKSFGAIVNANDKIKNLSVAQCQQVEIAKALSQSCDLLILDEPTASLAPEEVELLFKVIKKLAENNISIIYISHRLEEVLQISDRITVLRDGHKIKTVNVSEINQEGLINLILGTDKSILGEKRKNNYTKNEELLRVVNLNIKGKLENISFHLNKGEILGIAGLMGSGRTELLQAIFGNYRIASGEIYIKGKKYIPQSPEKAVRYSLSLVPEDRKGQGLILTMSLKDNIAFAGLRSFYKFGLLQIAKERNMVESVVERLNIKLNSIYQRISSLSGGNQQKVVFGKWLLVDSDILLLDEPTRGIDVGTKEEIFNIVDNLASQGKSVIFVSSVITEVANISDRILVFYGRKIVKELPKTVDINTLTKYTTGG